VRRLQSRSRLRPNTAHWRHAARLGHARDPGYRAFLLSVRAAIQLILRADSRRNSESVSELGWVFRFVTFSRPRWADQAKAGGDVENRARRKHYAGTWVVENGMLTLEHRTKDGAVARKSAHVGGMGEKSLAVALLSELIGPRPESEEK